MNNTSDIGNVPKERICRRCGKIMAVLPNNYTCLNKTCHSAGALIPRENKSKSGGNEMTWDKRFRMLKKGASLSQKRNN